MASADTGVNVKIREWEQEHGSDMAAPESDEVHVWFRSLAATPAEIARLTTLLSSEERARAARFYSERLQSDFITGRGTLRLLLAGYEHLAPEKLAFEYSSFGKPSLIASDRFLSFNLSHSGEVVIYAFAVGRRIGVDVEKFRCDFDVGKIGKRFFSSAEQSALEDLPAAQRYEAFFRCWSRKEAFIKALGEGLSHPLHRFDVSLQPGNKNALLQTRPDPKEATRWMLCDLALNPEYAAALALELCAAPAAVQQS